MYISILMVLNAANKNNNGLYYGSHDIYGLPFSFNVKFVSPRILMSKKQIWTGPEAHIKWSLFSPFTMKLELPGTHKLNVRFKSVSKELAITDTKLTFQVTNINKFRAQLSTIHALGVQSTDMLGFRNEAEAKNINLIYEGSSLQLKGILKKEYIPNTQTSIYAEDIRLPQTFGLSFDERLDLIDLKLNKDISQGITYIDAFNMEWKKFSAKGSGKIIKNQRNKEEIHLIGDTTYPLEIIKHFAEKDYLRERDVVSFQGFFNYLRHTQKKSPQEPIFVNAVYSDNFIRLANFKAPFGREISTRYNTRKGIVEPLKSIGGFDFIDKNENKKPVNDQKAIELDFQKLLEDIRPGIIGQ